METVSQDDPIMNKAHKQFKKFTKSEQLMDEYEGRIKYRLDHNSRMHAAKEEGLQQGLAKGLEQAKLEDAKNLKKLGVEVGIISKATGLSEEAVKGL